MDKIRELEFKKITNQLFELYYSKNMDYGDSFSKTFDEFGEIAGLVRINDKVNRLNNLFTNETKSKEMSLSNVIDAPGPFWKQISDGFGGTILFQDPLKEREEPEQTINFESKRDNYLDLANYVILQVMEMDLNNKEIKKEEEDE